VFVHALDGSLTAMDDPQQVSPVVLLAVPPGTYTVMVRNPGTSAARVSIETTPAAARGGGAADLAVVRVFYATDRRRLATTPVSYDAEPGPQTSYGHADVTIPRAAHEMGELEGPSIWRLEFSADPEKHVVIKAPGPVPLGWVPFLRNVTSRASESPHRQVLVFVHGFNVAFEEALRRTAQISYDIAFDGATVLFSWPSQGGPFPWDYRKDERNAALSVDSFKSFLSALAAESPRTTIHIVTHSMGSRVVSGALQQLAAEIKSGKPRPLGEVTLLAPDIDAELFRRAVGRLAATARRVTLYASERDEALAISKQNAGYTRAGQAGSEIVVVPGLDTIDATQVETSVLGLRHLYYADNSTILSDLFHVLRGLPASERARLERAGQPPAMFWRFRKAAR
jgi:esterase/lipase superfamily enzyme